MTLLLNTSALKECFEWKLSHWPLLHLFGEVQTPPSSHLHPRAENLEHTNLCYDLSDWTSANHIARPGLGSPPNQLA